MKKTKLSCSGNETIPSLIISIPHNKVSIVTLKQETLNCVEQFKRMIFSIETRSVPITLFAFVQFPELLGMGNRIESIDENAKLLDTVLLWSPYILTGLVFDLG